MENFKTIYTLFQSWTGRRKITVLTLLLILIFSTIALCIWISMPHYGILFNQLDVKDTHQIIKILENKAIPYRIENQGRDILISKENIEKTRIQLMGSGMQLSNTVGFELFDKSDFGMTDFSQKINYQRALQGELERTIASFEEVSSVRVHLVIPEQKLFQENAEQTSAAVTLDLRKPLKKSQLLSIQQLIKASVARLDPKNIVIIDQKGHSLLGKEEDALKDQFALKERLEKYLTGKVNAFLEPIFGPQQCIVKIDITLNYDQREEESVKPEHQGLVTHEKETENTQTHKMEKSTAQKNISREKRYQLGSKKERFIHAAGTIEYLAVSVALPENTDSKRIQQIENLVKSIVGFKASRGDNISVEALISPIKKEEESKLVMLPQASINYSKIFLSAIFLLLLGLSISLLFFRKKKTEQRELLLIELKQWLEHHAK